MQVHTGHSTMLGRSDAPHHPITSAVDKRTGRALYETEAEHANEQTLFSKVDHTQHGQDMDTNGDTAVPPSRDVDDRVWYQMTSALTDLMTRGYDVGLAEAYMPMLEAHEIPLNMEAPLYRFYQHLMRRAAPKWSSEEPMEVVACVRQFLAAYEALKGINNKKAYNR
jgi:hypothetical protein